MPLIKVHGTQEQLYGTISAKPNLFTQAWVLVQSLMSKFWQNHYMADQSTKLGTAIPQHV